MSEQPDLSPVDMANSAMDDASDKESYHGYSVDDEDQPRGVSARKMLAALLMVGVAVAIIAGTLFYLGRQSGGSGPPEHCEQPWSCCFSVCCGWS